MTVSTSTRRAFLRAVCGAAAALPFFKVLERSALEVNAADPPLKLVTLYHGHGVAKEYWFRRPGETETSFDIAYDGCSLRPFDDPARFGKSYKDRLLVVEGLSYVSAMESQTAGHHATAAIYTGSNVTTDDTKQPYNSSIDQFLAQEKGLGKDSPFTSLAFSVGAWINTGSWDISYGPGGQPVTKMPSPDDAWDLIFSKLVGMDDPATKAAAERQRKLGKSVLDYAQADLARTYARLAGPEREKLDQHLSALRDLEKRLDAVAAAGCMIPDRPKRTGNPDPADDFPATYANNGGEPYYERITELQLDLASQALACGLTRFVSVFLNDCSVTQPNKYVEGLGSLPTNFHDDVAHLYSSDVVSQRKLAAVNEHHYRMAAGLLQRLDQTGIIDSTLLMMASELGDPSGHDMRHVPFILAGGANGKIPMGRHMVASTNSDFPHNRLLVSVANVFGANITSFGTTKDPAIATGELSGLL